MELTDKPVRQLMELAKSGVLSECDLVELKSDPRKGVLPVIKLIERNQAESERLKRLLQFDQNFAAFVAGLDEAGRGPLAGPVVAAAVVSGTNLLFPGINDSKKLSADRRETLAEKIMQSGARYSIGMASSIEIDRINILEATRLAMMRALEGLEIKDIAVITDALFLPAVKRQINPIKGDSLSLSVAAASILAKTHRDNLMEEADAKWPQYGFALHKGYGTASHMEAIRQFGPCPLHRMSFAPLNRHLSQKE